jgi:hypothetical protein
VSAAAGQTLHIHPGDCSADALRAAGIGGEVLVWCDVLTAGPLRLEPGDAARRERAEALSKGTGGAMSVDQCERRLRRQDEALLAYRDFPETVLWFDACLYDQTIMVHLLDWFAKQDLTGRQLSLICIGEYPGFKKFCGLGELTPEQLADLVPQRIPVTPAMLDLAERAWRALCADTPQAVQQLANANTSDFPYLGEALIRFLEQFPSTGNGLSRLQRECLEALVSGPTNPVEVFKAASAAEPHPFFGDTMLWGCLNGLAGGNEPLITVTGPEPRLPQWDPKGINRWELALTPVGEQVLAGEVDAIEVNGLDRWHGGTHLTPDSLWRWDRATQRIVRS